MSDATTTDVVGSTGDGHRVVASGGDLLVELLLEHGVDVAFGVVSVHNMPLVDALVDRLRFVPVRHEAAAVNAADAYGRVTGGFGVALTSTGTGAGNAAGALVEALTAGSSVLHVTGQIDSAHLGAGKGVIHETRDQLGMLRAVSSFAATVTDTTSSAELLRRAIAATDSDPRGPASIEWPIDLQFRPQALPPPSPVEIRLPRPDPDSLERAAGLIGRARRPLVWAGGGAIRARQQVAAFLDRTGAGLLTSNAGRGVLPESDPRCVGNYATASGCGELIASADVLVSIGTHFRSNETRDFSLPLPQAHVQIDVDPEAIGRSYPATVGLHGDAASTLETLLDHVPQVDADPSWRGMVEATRELVRRHQRARIGPQARISDELRAALPDRSVIARDVTIPSSTWGNRLLEIYDPTTNVYARGGGIGQGVAMGIGAAVARPEEPTLVIVGDGGLAVHLGELLTVGQERPWLVVVVFNDGGYGVLRNMQDHHVGRRSGVDLHTPDFGMLARACGLPHALVADGDDFLPTLRDLSTSRGPCLIEVDVAAVGDHVEPFIPPVPVPDRAARDDEPEDPPRADTP